MSLLGKVLVENAQEAMGLVARTTGVWETMEGTYLQIISATWMEPFHMEKKHNDLLSVGLQKRHEWRERPSRTQDASGKAERLL